MDEFTALLAIACTIAGVFSLVACWALMVDVAHKAKLKGWMFGLLFVHAFVLPFFLIRHWSIARPRAFYYVIPLLCFGLIYPFDLWHEYALIDKRTAQLMKEPYNPKLHGDLAKALVSLNRYDEALPHAEAAFSGSPKDIEYADNFSFLLAKKGEHARVVEVIASVIPLSDSISDSKALKIYCRLATAYKVIGATDRAEKITDALTKDHLSCQPE